MLDPLANNAATCSTHAIVATTTERDERRANASASSQASGNISVTAVVIIYASREEYITPPT